jgi:hypothetical protein
MHVYKPRDKCIGNSAQYETAYDGALLEQLFGYSEVQASEIKVEWTAFHMKCREF